MTVKVKTTNITNKNKKLVQGSRNLYYPLWPICYAAADVTQITQTTSKRQNKYIQHKGSTSHIVLFKKKKPIAEKDQKGPSLI